VTSAAPTDLDGIRALLEAVGLSSHGVAAGLAGFVVAREGGRIVATARLDSHGTAGVLRSVATAPDRRGRGLTARVVKHVLGRSWAQGHHAVYLLTTDAAGYFRRLGFLQTDRAAVPDAVLASEQFRSAACASAVIMVLRRPARPARETSVPGGQTDG